MTSELLAPRNTEEAMASLRDLVESGVAKYPRLCLKAQRELRGIPMMFPTALSASNATPVSERVYEPADFRRGMVAFSYDPNIPGTAGHVFAIVGRDKRGNVLTGTNDAYDLGVMDYVPLSFYTNHWGHKLQFAATWLNGYDFADFNEPPKPVYPGGLGDQYRHALEILVDVFHKKRAKYGPSHPLVLALHKDIERMRRKLERFPVGPE